jgi:hypothetical protein
MRIRSVVGLNSHRKLIPLNINQRQLYTDPQSSQVKLVIEAPREVLILGQELLRKPSVNNNNENCF